MEREENHIKFVYDEAAAIVTAGEKDYLVIGDLHIGAELPLIKRGIKIYNAERQMLKKIREIAGEFKTKNLIILGDIKDTILYPELRESNAILTFFNGLKEENFNVVITAGNHDPHLNEIVDCKIVDELIVGDFAFLHGHRWPSDNAMKEKFLFAGHNHIAIGIEDRSGGYYNQKAWLTARFSRKYGLEKYPHANRGIQLVVLPAFNDLIIGMPLGRLPQDKNLSPLFRNKIFDYKSAMVYGLRGERIGRAGSIKNRYAKRKSSKQGSHDIGR